ncbi:MAG: hypothetical protein AAGF83_02185 [Cyanobacteria bacterium P01_G01_bin.67]
MPKLQDIYLVTTILWLGLNTTSIVDAKVSTNGSQQKSNSWSLRQSKINTLSSEYSTLTLTKSDTSYQLAQKTTPESKPDLSDEEMLDVLQQRQEKIDQNLGKLKKLSGADSDSSKVEQVPLDDEEMIDAINQRQNKIKELKELKQLEDSLRNKEMLETLQEQNFNVDSIEDLKTIQEIVNDQNLNQEEIFAALQEQNINVDSVEKLKQLRKILKPKRSSSPKPSGLSSPMAFKMLTIGLPATLLVFLIATPFAKGILGVFKSNYEEKFGKPKVPEGSINLHSRSFKEITLIGNKAEKINNDKFGNEEFLLLLRIKINMSREAEGYKGLSNCVDLLQAGIIAQKSFLRLEQTELRYRSRRQQEFYQYVADNLEDGEELEREAFAKKVKKKQTEVLPLITTEEGREAINTYAKEINVLSKYKLGLKLLALFKQYELQDFSILKNISDVVETLEGKDLISSDDLVSPVLENYESFEKLGPIIGISAAESTPQAYAKILQVIGLTNRHGKAYLEFGQLVTLLKKWEKPYKAIALVRKEYTEDKYSLPAEFKSDIPGVAVYQKYAEYLPDL